MLKKPLFMAGLCTIACLSFAPVKVEAKVKGPWGLISYNITKNNILICHWQRTVIDFPFMVSYQNTQTVDCATPRP
ncbi:hypothetical protein [Mixta intestinalis]|jgi:hypothetical protein|uniref:Uncharacterized protein n=1 Tax=Mixta intestinalis TaxID=1615494 RepID=A0A6P1PWE2_9GAMM|nr:hypothetical protein [Mixta intestinalis]QHM70412.1 hypothetical protein C7M51_00685 [Mixta intestinalis]